jgi:hypothetical protein
VICKEGKNKERREGRKKDKNKEREKGRKSTTYPKRKQDLIQTQIQNVTLTITNHENDDYGNKVLQWLEVSLQVQ